MILRNETRGTLIASDASVACTFTQRLLGLMGKRRMEPAAALVIENTHWIHTFWMYFSLDAIYINRNWTVAGLELDLRPNRIGRPFWSAHSVI